MYCFVCVKIGCLWLFLLVMEQEAIACIFPKALCCLLSPPSARSHEMLLHSENSRVDPDSGVLGKSVLTWAEGGWFKRGRYQEKPVHSSPYGGYRNSGEIESPATPAIYLNGQINHYERATVHYAKHYGVWHLGILSNFFHDWLVNHWAA